FSDPHHYPFAQEEKLKKSRIMALGAIVAGSALVLSACTPPPEEPGTVEGTSINVGWNQPFFSYNSNTSKGNNVTNSLVEYLTRDGFQYYDNSPALVKNDKYGTFELISEDPQQVKYTINEGVVWSDGVQIDAADMLLQWAALSGNVLDYPKTEEEGKTWTAPFFDYASLGDALSWITKTPEIGEDGRTITLEYDQPYVDWELAFSVGVPAHVVVQLAHPDITDPADAKKQLIKAIQDKNVEWMNPVAEAWNTAFDFDATPSDAKLLVGSGPYLIEKIEKDQYLTVVANPKFSWGKAPRFERITLRYYGDATAALQAMQNKEISIYDGQPSPDLLTQLDAAKTGGITYVGTAQASYEHVDLVFNNGGPFDAATYGGDAAKALAVRQAFMKVIPRAQILEDLIVPLQSNAVLRDSQFFIPGGEGYADSVKKSGADAYDTQDFEGAKKLLADAGITTPIDVRFMHAANNPRREQIATLIQSAGTESGLFNVKLDARTTWGSDLGDGTYDAVTFAWASTSTAVGGSDQIYATAAGSNFNGYSNAIVDKTSKELQAEFDTAKQIELQQIMDEQLWKDGYGVTLFQFPGLTFWDSNVVSNVSGNTFVPYYFWNFWEWEPIVAETPAK
ncbi:MAG: ABC transporter family substrate-binding protein, partial [Microbacteriaceae bacterium]